MNYLSFENGDKIPALGLGTWKSAKGEVYSVIRNAIEIGYRHFDCAFLYGNEAEIGDAFSDALKAGDVRREDLWIIAPRRIILRGSEFRVLPDTKLNKPYKTNQTSVYMM